MNGDGGDGWRKRPASPMFRVLNPELYVTPNLRVGILGTSAFFLIIAGLMWQKHSYEKQQLALQSTLSKSGDFVFKEGD